MGRDFTHWIFIGFFTFALAACGSGGERVEVLDESLSVDIEGADGFADSENQLAISHVANVLAPEFESDGSSFKPQATNFRLSGSVAYVSYNTAGAQVAGGVEAFDISNERRPQLLFSALSKEHEFADLELTSTHLFAVGNNAEGAVMVIYDLRARSIPPPVVATFELDGFVATSIAIESDRAHLSVGDNSGLVVVDISEPVDPVIELAYSLNNSLSVVRYDSQSFVLGGDSSLSLYEVDGGNLSSLVELSNQANEAPVRAVMKDDSLLVNPDTGELLIYDLSDLDSVELVSESSVGGNGNGIALYRRYAFLAQGDQGVNIVDINDEENPRRVGRLDFLNDSGSANQVYVRKGVVSPLVFIADGRGGFQVLNFARAIKLIAYKYYKPSRWEDAVIDVSGSTYRYRVPKELPVGAGNAGNHWADLYFDDVRCRYRGGSDQSKPKEGSNQWNKGLSYNRFQGCSDGSQVGDWIEVSREVRLNIANGHSDFASTRVDLNLAVEE